MKIYSLLAFSLLIISSCGKGIREEVTKRYQGGEKKVVVKYQGTGSEERILERLTYSKSGELIKFEDLESDSVKNYVDLNPKLEKPEGLKNYLQGTWTKRSIKEDDIKKLIFNDDTLKIKNTFIDDVLGVPNKKDTSKVFTVWLVEYQKNKTVNVAERVSETYRGFSSTIPDTTVRYSPDHPERFLSREDKWITKINFNDSNSFESNFTGDSLNVYSRNQ